MAAESGFDFLFTVSADGNIPVSKYKSKSTGISVFIAQIDGPIVNGYFCLATEAHDDDGLPHTLEHLVFMGSEDFPYKGILDLVANRCLASGTNAWTDTDHTCYTMTNAGSEGFLKLMPYYLDHILYPTLTESGFVTEVHHINGEGEDAGVVYCEMQGRENTGESRCHLEMVRAAYPGHCGYKSETGGRMANLRESTTHTKVKNYHQEFYRPENLCLIITGQITADEVFKALKPIEEKVISKGDRPSFIQPWQNPVPPLPESKQVHLKYAADEVTHGMVYIAWRGPHVKEQYTLNALAILQDYLGESAISPLQKELVEIPDPYCSQVSYSTLENSETLWYFNFKNVPTEKLQQVQSKVFEILENTAKGALDMTRMESLIHKKILETLNNVEDSPHDTMSFILIGDFLYGKDKQDLDSRVNIIPMYKKMKTESEQFWKELITCTYLSKSHVLIIGEPSKSFMEEQGQIEKERIEKQRLDLGEEGLQKMADILEDATEENEEEPPEEMLTSVAVPDVSGIHFHHINSSSNINKETTDKNPAFQLNRIPFKFLLDDMNTNFVLINALLDTSSVSQELKNYLPLFCGAMFESPVYRNGELVSHEEVIKQLEADTLSYEGGFGVNGGSFSCGDYPQLYHIRLKVEQDKYEKGVKWLQELMYRTKFTADRLKIIAQKMANDVVSDKRKGAKVTRTVLGSMLYERECNVLVCGMLRQEKFLRDLLTRLDTDPDKVLKDIDEVRQIVGSPSNIKIHMSANVKALIPSPEDPWLQFLPQDVISKPSSMTMKKTYEYILPYDTSPKQKVIVGMGSVESSYLIQCVPGINNFEDPDIPAVMVFIQYVTQLEGPMWRQIRGLGLSYNYAMYQQAETGMLTFLLAKSTHITDAYSEGKKIVMGYVEGETQFNEVELESARSSLIFEIIEDEKTPSEVSHMSLLSYFRGVSRTYNRDLMRKVANVSIADLQRVGPKYIANLFDPSKARTAVVCHPTKVEEVKEDFHKLGLDFSVLPSLEEDFLCSY